MRYALLLLVFVINCRGPKSADAAPPTKETIVEALDRYEALSAARETDTASKVDTLSETVGNQTSELEGVKEELRGVKAGMESLEGKVDGLQKLLTASEQPESAVPQVSEPPAIVIELAEPVREVASSLLFHGKPINADEWLSTPLRDSQVVEVEVNRRKADRAAVERHVRDHGVSGDLSKYNRSQLIQIHSVAHLKDDVKPVKSASKPPVVMNAAVVQPRYRYQGNCANGNCARQWSYSWSRRR